MKIHLFFWIKVIKHHFDISNKKYVRYYMFL